MMKEFTNLLEAFNYHKTCCLCDNLMKPSDSIYENKVQYNLSANVDSETDDIMSINVLTNDVSIRSFPRTMMGQTPIVSYSAKRYNGVLFESINFRCIGCYYFNYTIQIQIEMDSKSYSLGGNYMYSPRVIGIYLNSEQITIEEPKTEMHYIKSVYATNQTEYHSYRAGQLHNSFKIPLVELNLKNPQQTLERIKKLATFS
jgi:hypothetical protein